MRIACLVPSLTETLFALGLGPYVIARTGFCIHPAAEVARLPKVGGTKDVNLPKLAKLHPTHVVVNVDENRAELAEALAHWDCQLIVTHPLAPADNLALLAQLAEPFVHLPQVAQQAAALSAGFERELALARAPGLSSPRILYLIWRDPWMGVAADTYIARSLAHAGLHSLPKVMGGAAGAGRYPVISGDEPWLAEVDEIWLSSEPYRFTAEHLPMAQALCPSARLRLVDGEAASWYGVRALVGLPALRALAAQAVAG